MRSTPDKANVRKLDAFGIIAEKTDDTIMVNQISPDNLGSMSRNTNKLNRNT